MSARLSIGNTEYDFFNKVSIDLKYGFSASSFSFSALFDAESATHRRLFRPLTYQVVRVISNLDERLITGNVLTTKTTRTSVQTLSSLSGYSRTGFLSDCSIPIENYPLQYTNLTFRELAEKLIDPFNIRLIVNNDNGVANEVIPEITTNASSNIYSFLSEIAAQRNLVLTHTPFGNLLLDQPAVNRAPVATFDESIPSTEISLNINGQAMHSPITVLKQADIINDNASETSISNPLVGVFRPKVAEQNIGNDVTVEDAARNVRANELRNIRLTIKTDRWQWLNNGQPQTMTPNNIIQVTSPDNFIFRPTRFFVEQVNLSLDHNQETAVLRCVLPEVFTNQNPRSIFA